MRIALIIIAGAVALAALACSQTPANTTETTERQQVSALQKSEGAEAAISLGCEFAIRRYMNDQPLLAAKALETNPDDLTDEERMQWYVALGDPPTICPELWSEPAEDAPDKRNEDFFGACYNGLTVSAVHAYENEWVPSGHYSVYESVWIPGGEEWPAVNRPDENPWILAMALMDKPYFELSERDRADLNVVMDYSGLGTRETCEAYYPQAFSDRWTPVWDIIDIDDILPPYPSPTPTPVGYQRSATVPDDEQMATYQRNR